MTPSYDFVVVGAGVMGRSTVLYLALQYPQAKIGLVEQYKSDHEEGSSHSKIRIIRSAYIHPFYRDLTLQGSQINWKELEELFKTNFLVENPFLAFIEDDDQFNNYLQVAESSTHIKKLSIEEVRKMFPSAPKVDMGNKPVFYDTRAGIVLAEKYMVAVLQFLKIQPNVDLFFETELLSLKNNSKGVTLQLKRHDKKMSIFAKKVSLSCGRWIGKLVPAVKSILKEVRQTVSFWLMKNPQEFGIGKCPSYLHRVNHKDTYCLPDVEGEGLKYAVHSQDASLEGKFATEGEFLSSKTEEIRSKIGEHYQGKYQSINKVEKCYYTVTKSQDFLIDWTDEHENVLICSPCSGHGFKFGPIIGKIVADLLEKDESIELFEKFRYLTRLFYHQGVNLD